MHSYLTPRLQIPNRGESFHEKIASWNQLQFHPQEHYAQFVREHLAAERSVLPFASLANGERIAGGAYWQARAAVGMLLTTPKYREKLPALIEGFKKKSSTNITHQWRTLGSCDEAFGREWRSFATDTYLGEAAKPCPRSRFAVAVRRHLRGGIRYTRTDGPLIHGESIAEVGERGSRRFRENIQGCQKNIDTEPGGG